jgi:hypothetical protein
VPSSVEKFIYQERSVRPEMTVRDATMLIQQQLGYKLELTDDDLLDWIDQKI